LATTYGTTEVAPFPKTYVNPSFSAAYKGDSGNKPLIAAVNAAPPKIKCSTDFFRSPGATHRAGLKPPSETAYYVTYYLTIVTSENYKRPIDGYCTAVL
jgi:hypothetical protein